MELPRCDARDDEAVRAVLTDWERGRLVQEMVEKGVDAGLSSAVRDAVKAGRPGAGTGDKGWEHGGLFKAFDMARKRLEGQARELRGAAGARAEKARATELKRYKVVSRDFKKRGEDAEGRYKFFDGDIDRLVAEDELVGLVLEDDEAGQGELTAWQRFRLRMADLWYRIRRALARFWAWLTGRRGRASEKRMATPHRIMIMGRDMSDSLRRALYLSPRFRKRMDGLVKAQVKEDGDIGSALSPEEYEALAAKAFDDYLKERRKEAAEEKKRQKQAIEEEGAVISKEKEREEEAHRRKLDDIEKEKEKGLASVDGELDDRAIDEVKRAIRKDLEGMGYISRGKEGAPMVTGRMMDHFADILYGMEMRGLAARVRPGYGASEEKQGTYEKMEMRSVHEISRSDLVESIIRARVQHPRKKGLYDDDFMIYNEMSSRRNHVVLMFDKSGSMEENGRISAAKKAVLALYKAAKRSNKKNIVDLVAFDTQVHVTDLVELWDSKPAGFTNTGEALRTARGLISGTKADRKVVYLITDGLPEAFTDKDGKDRAGDRKKSLEYALQQARLLGKVHGQRLIILLLEPEEGMYVDAATEIARQAEGRLVVTDPARLSGDMLVDYATATAGA